MSAKTWDTEKKGDRLADWNHYGFRAIIRSMNLLLFYHYSKKPVVGKKKGKTESAHCGQIPKLEYPGPRREKAVAFVQSVMWSNTKANIVTAERQNRAFGTDFRLVITNQSSSIYISNMRTSKQGNRSLLLVLLSLIQLNWLTDCGCRYSGAGGTAAPLQSAPGWHSC